MRIKYKVSIDDLVAFSLFHYKHSTFFKRHNIIYCVIFPTGIFIFSCLDGLYRGKWSAPVIGAVIGVAFILWILGGQQKRFKKNVRKILSEGSNKVAVGEHELELTGNGLIERSEYGEGRFTWDVIERIGFTPDYTFIFTGAAQGLPFGKANVLEGNYEEFKEELRRKFEEKLRAESDGQNIDLGKRLITDTKKIYKEDTGFGKNSRLGVASFVTAIVVGVLDFSLFGFLIIHSVIASDEVQRGSIALKIFATGIMLGLAANIAGVVLGISGMCQKNREKLLSILGLIFNSVMIIGFALLITLGKALS